MILKYVGSIPDSLTKTFDRLIAATGVRRITFHGLRHTHISHQLMDGVHVKVVSEQAGHANVSITLSVYAAFIPTLQDDAAAGVDAWLRQSLAEQVGDNYAISAQTKIIKLLELLDLPG